jgi:ribosomal protein S18 acetylase RimI-like enzyme
VTNTLDTIRLRRATTSDAGLLAELGARLFEETFGPDNAPEDMRLYLASAFSEAKQIAELADDNRATWIALDSSDGSIGYASMRRGTRADGIVADRPAEVQRIYSDRGWHGRGVAAALMSACVEQARAWECDVLWLAVWERNPRAIAFYEKTGFRKVGRQIFALGRDLQHDDVMARSLG